MRDKLASIVEASGPNRKREFATNAFYSAGDKQLGAENRLKQMGGRRSQAEEKSALHLAKMVGPK